MEQDKQDLVAEFSRILSIIIEKGGGGTKDLDDGTVLVSFNSGPDVIINPDKNMSEQVDQLEKLHF